MRCGRCGVSYTLTLNAIEKSMAVPIASSTAVVTSLFGTFWQVLVGPGVYVMGGLIAVALVFWGYRALRSQFHGGRK